MSDASERRRVVKLVFRVLLGLMMIGAGVMHFAKPEVYVAMMPDYLPWHRALVLISGVFEVGLGAALFVRDQQLRVLAGWGLIALLIAVLPANVWMATHGPIPGLEMSPVVAWIRVALQGVLVWWAWAVTRPDEV